MWRRGIDVGMALLLGVSAGAAVHVAQRWEQRGQSVAVEVASATLSRTDPLDDRALVAARGGVWAVEASGCGESRQASATIADVPGIGVTAITNAHVVAGSVTVKLRSPAGEQYVVAVTGAAADRDVATLEIDPDGPIAAEIEASALVSGDSAVVGDPVAVVGYPGGRAEVRRASVVAVELRTARGGTGRVLIVDAEVTGGSSGGAVVDTAGAFVGLVAARDPSTGHAVAYPADQVFDAARSTGVTPGC